MQYYLSYASMTCLNNYGVSWTQQNLGQLPCGAMPWPIEAHAVFTYMYLCTCAQYLREM